MSLPLPISLGLRYTRAKRRSGFLSFMSMASIVGLALSVIALIVTIAVMSGFQREFRERLLSMVAHATVSGVGGQPLLDWERALTLAKEDARVIGAAPYVESEALLGGVRTRPSLLRGILPGRETEVIDLRMLEGSLDDLRDGEFNVVLGRELAAWLGVRVGDQVNATVLRGSSTPMGFIPNARRFTVVGVFEVGAKEYDAGLALVHMHDAQRLLRMGEGVSGVRLKLEDMFQAFAVASDLASRLDGYHGVRDWSRDHATLFGALQLEKTVMFILLLLLVVIAAFQLLSSLVMLVADKQADIAILRTMGLAPGQVMGVFVTQGMVVGVVGVLIGVVGGVSLTLSLGAIIDAVEWIFSIEVMPADVYYISGVPTVLQASDIATITIAALVMCLLATLYPAWRASRVDPASALRYE